VEIHSEDFDIFNENMNETYNAIKEYYSDIYMIKPPYQADLQILKIFIMRFQDLLIILVNDELTQKIINLKIILKKKLVFLIIYNLNIQYLKILLYIIINIV
jgi:hypothetical protein